VVLSARTSRIKFEGVKLNVPAKVGRRPEKLMKTMSCPFNQVHSTLSSETSSRVGSVSEFWVWTSSTLREGLNWERRFKTRRWTPVYESSFGLHLLSSSKRSAPFSCPEPRWMKAHGPSVHTHSLTHSPTQTHTASCTAPSGHCWKHNVTTRPVIAFTSYEEGYIDQLECFSSSCSSANHPLIFHVLFINMWVTPII